MIGSNKKNIFLLLSIFISGQNVIASENDPGKNSWGSTKTTMVGVGLIIVTNLINWATTRWYFKSPTNSPEQENNGSKTNLPDIQYESVDRLNQNITKLMTSVYENPKNTPEDFERVQQLKEKAETKEPSPTPLILIEEKLKKNPTLKTYGDLLEHLNALACNLQPNEQIQTEDQPKTTAYQINPTLPTEDKITALKNNMYANVTKKDTQPYTETLKLIKQKPNNQYSPKILDALLECLTSSDLTLARYNTCENAAQVQHVATNS